MNAVDTWSSMSPLAKVASLVVTFLLASVSYSNWTRNYVNGKKILNSRFEFLPFGMDVVILHAFINPWLGGGYGHLGRLVKACRGVYGKAFGSKAGPVRVFMVNDPEMIKHITATNFSNYDKGDVFVSTLRPFLGAGIFNSDGAAWKHQRAIAKEHFNREDVTEMVDVFRRHAATLDEIITEAVGLKKSVDVQDLFQKFTLDSVGDIMFKYEFDSLKKSSDFAVSFDYLQTVSIYRLRNPMWRLSPFKKQHLYDAHLKICHSIVEKIVKSCLEDKNLKDRTDLLAHFAQSKDENDQPHTITYLRDACLNFLLAGRDTTAALLTWTLYCVSSHPEVEQKLVQEIDDVIGDKEPDAENLRDLRYMRLVLQEVLRLYPSVPMNVRTANEDDYLPNGDFVPKGTNMIFSQFVMSRMTDVFGEDAEKFDPERWAEGRVSSIRPFYAIPFHAGPRTCLGQQMALTETKFMLAFLYQKYNIRQAGPNGQEIHINNSLILGNKFGMNMELSLRSK